MVAACPGFLGVLARCIGWPGAVVEQDDGIILLSSLSIFPAHDRQIRHGHVRSLPRFSEAFAYPIFSSSSAIAIMGGRCH